MALCALSDDALGVICEGLRSVLDPRVVVGFSSASRELWALTQALLQQLRADYEAVAALCVKVGLRGCKELREAKQFNFPNQGLSGADLALLGTLGSVLTALEQLYLVEPTGTLP